DAQKVWVAPCDMTIDKLCAVVPTPAPYVCTKPIKGLTMIWTGPGTVLVKAVVVKNGPTLSFGPVAQGSPITVGGDDGTLGNDVFWNIYDSTGTTFLGQSTFHLSCSDVDMAGTNSKSPDDNCGDLQGDGKLEQGTVVNCTAGSLPTTSNHCVNL